MIFRGALRFGILCFVSLIGWVNKMYSGNYSEIALYQIGWVTITFIVHNVG